MLSKRENKASSLVTLPEMVLEDSQHELASRPSSYSSPSMISHHHEQAECGSEEDVISISDVYLNSRPTSSVDINAMAVPFRAPTPISISSIPLELPAHPPPALAFHRPFPLPKLYPVAQLHTAKDATHDGSVVPSPTQESPVPF